MESLPFLRTMQTLEKIGRELRISGCNLNYRAQEVLFPEAYKSNPIPQLVSQTTPLSEMSEQYGFQTTFHPTEDFKTEAFELWPEPADEGRKRIMNNIQHWAQ